MNRSLFTAMALVAATACGESGTPGVAGPPPADTLPTPTTFLPASPVHVAGNRLVNAAGAPVRLRGVNRSGTEFMCAQGRGIFDGPSDSISVRAIARWRATAVRVPMNEACWLGINGVKPAYAGAAYQEAIAAYVATLNRYGLIAILELHWSGAGSKLPLEQDPMPNRDHSVEFWRQVANAYKGNNAVVFDLFNEPFPDTNHDTPAAWLCWRDGGSCAGMAFQAAGMKELVIAVRGTGATNVIMLGGVGYSSRLSGWLTYMPSDPAGNLAASWHVYNFSGCSASACWDSEALPVSRQVPLILGELGQDDRGSAFITRLMDWMDALPAGGSYLAWMWDVWIDDKGVLNPLAVITSYDGTPSPYGMTFKTRFAR